MTACVLHDRARAGDQVSMDTRAGNDIFLIWHQSDTELFIMSYKKNVKFRCYSKIIDAPQTKFYNV